MQLRAVLCNVLGHPGAPGECACGAGKLGTLSAHCTALTSACTFPGTAVESSYRLRSPNSDHALATLLTASAQAP